nr:SMP-30/gluconolactonase/LRE family protein [Sinobaca sp. H24]
MEVQKKWSPVTTSNGLAWNNDKRAMYYIDTPTQSIVQFDYSVEDGAIRSPALIIDFSEEQGKPDGMTIDANGNLWIAHFEGSRVSCWNPDTGKNRTNCISLHH